MVSKIIFFEKEEPNFTYLPKTKQKKKQKNKKTTANSAKLVSGSWCTQQDSNLWPFDS